MAQVGPSLIYGGERFKGTGKLQASAYSSPLVKGYLRFIRALKENASTGFGPQDAFGEVSLTPPSSVESVARAVAAAALGEVKTGEDGEEILLFDGTEAERPADLIDGTLAIERVAETFGTPALLAAAAAKASEGRAGGGGTANRDVALEPAAIDDGVRARLSASAFGAASEGNLYGFKPLLYPLGPAIALVGFFAGAIIYGEGGRGDGAWMGQG